MKTDIKKEKILILNKEKLKNLIYHKAKISEIYGEYDFKLNLLWCDEFNCYCDYMYNKNKHINKIIMDITIDTAINLTQLHVQTAKTYDMDSTMGENPYTFIIRAIEEINKEDSYIEFVFSDK